MGTLTISFALPGTPLKGGGTSFAGHMWYTTDDGTKSLSSGFGPPERVKGIAAAFNPHGKVNAHGDDNDFYLEKQSITVSATKAQIDILNDFGADPGKYGFNPWYNFLTNSCVDFVWSALNKAGINPKNFEGGLLPSWNKKYIDAAWSEYVRQHPSYSPWSLDLDVTDDGQIKINPICRPPNSGPSNNVNRNYSDAVMPPKNRDPLAIDLDNDGIETVGLDLNAPIMFDHNGDRIRTATGWLKGDDAWLVRDVNHNGVIESGLELFGADTTITLYNAPAKARDGFEALAALDSNNDKVFNAQDAAFTEVKLWQDRNQDAVSQADELVSLADKGIVSIALNYTAVNTQLSNGNTITGKAVVTRSSGNTEIDSIGIGSDNTAVNLDLSSNPFYREFPPIPLTQNALTLPQMKGSGVVRDLREAMSLGTPESAALAKAVTAFVAAQSRDEQRALLNEVVLAWAETASDLHVDLRRETGSYISFRNSENGWEVNGPRLRVSQVGFASQFGEKLDAVSSTWRNYLQNAEFINGIPNEDANRIAEIMRANNIALGWGITQDRNNLRVSLPLYLGIRSATDLVQKFAILDQFNGSDFLKAALFFAPDFNISYFRIWQNRTLLENAYQALQDSVYGALVIQTRLHPYLEAVSLDINEQGITFDTTGLANLLASRKGADERNALIDLMELNQYAQATLKTINFDGLGTLQTYLGGLATDSPLWATLSSLGLQRGAVAQGSTRGDVYLGDINGNTFKGDDGNDVISGAAGRDTLDGDAGEDTLLGGADDDKIAGGNDNDNLEGNDGNDTLYGDWGDDQLYGDAGDDRLEGGVGFDLLNGGAGADRLYGGADNDQLMGELGNDALYGEGGRDTLDGGSGQDTLYGGDADDLLFGGETKDYLYGEAGADTLNGGAEDDYMAGGTQDDYYLLDNPKDIVYEAAYADDPNSYDIIETSVSYAAPINVEALIASGDAALELTASSTGTELYGNMGNNKLKGGMSMDVLSGGGGLDTLEGGAGDDYYMLFDNKAVVNEAAGGGVDWVWAYANDITMADNTERLVMATNAPIKATGSDGNNYMTGNSRGNLLDGRKGSDRLFGKAGDDTLIGGLGDDSLDGGTGNDRYAFNAGDGSDTITDTEAAGLNADVLAFGGAIRSDQLWFSKSGSSLQISLIGTSDKVTINNWYAGDAGKIETITADGNSKTLSHAKVNDLVNAMSAFTAPAAGQTSLPSGYQTQLAGVMASSWV